MSKNLLFGNDVLNKTFNDTEFAWLPLSGFYLSLHTSDPGASGNQTTNECDYGGYARVSMSRNSGSWLVVGNRVENNITVVYPTCTGGTNTARYFAIGTSVNGLGKIIYSGALTSTLTIRLNVQPRFSKGSIVVLET